MAGGENSKFIVEFQAQTKKFKQSVAEIKAMQKEQNRDKQNQRKHEQRSDRDKQRHQQVMRRQQSKDRKDELKHVQVMSREEGKRHKLQLSYREREHRTNQRLAQREADQQRRLMQKMGGGAGGAGGGAGGQQQGPGKFRRFVGGVGAAVGGAGLFGLGMLIGAARSGYEKYMEYGQTLSKSIGLGRGRDIRRGVGRAGGGALGYSQTDVAGMVPLMARATGEVGPRELMQGARATGMGEGEVADQYGGIRRAGFEFTGAGKGKASAGGREFQKMISAGMQSGLEKGRLPEFTKGVMDMVNQQRLISTGVVNVGDIAKQLTLLGKSGRPGLQGEAGASVMQKFQQALMSPGGGEFGEAFVRQAMGFGKPGGTTGFYQAEKMRERGVSDPDNMMRIMSETKKQFGSGQEGNLALRELTGVSLQQAEDLQNIYDSTDSAKEKMSKIEEVMKSSESIEKQSLDNMKEIGGAAKRIAELTNRGIKIGEKAAPLIEKLEDWQYQGLQYLMQLAGDVRQIVDFIKDKFGDKDKVAAQKSAELQNTWNQPLSTDPVKRRAQLAERRRLEQQAATARGEQTFFSGALDAAGDVFGGKKLGSTAMSKAAQQGREAVLADQRNQIQSREFTLDAFRKSIGRTGANTPDEMTFLQTGQAPPDMMKWQAGVLSRRAADESGPMKKADTQAAADLAEWPTGGTVEHIVTFNKQGKDAREDATSSDVQGPGKKRTAGKR